MTSDQRSPSGPAPESAFPREAESFPAPDGGQSGGYRSSFDSLPDLPPPSTRTERPPAYALRNAPIAPVIPPPPPPPRAPFASASGAGGHMTRSHKGGISQAVRLIEKKHGAFFISRLILASGISLRGFDASTYDDPVTVSKFIKTLRTMLSQQDLDALLAQTSLQTNQK